MLLEVRDLHSYYGKSQVLHGVSLDVPAGEITCLLGRNGVGKSTTLKSMVGVVAPRRGTVRIQGKDVTGLAPHRLARMGIGYVPEERRVFATLSVRENLLMGQRKQGQAESTVWSMADVLKLFPSLDRRLDAKGGTLSGGEQQMLAMARALVGSPHVVLIDEPTEGLAPVIVEVVEDVIREIARRGIGVLLVESKLAVAERLAMRVLVMSKGEIVYRGTAEALARNAEVRRQHLEV